MASSVLFAWSLTLLSPEFPDALQGEINLLVCTSTMLSVQFNGLRIRTLRLVLSGDDPEIDRCRDLAGTSNVHWPLVSLACFRQAFALGLSRNLMWWPGCSGCYTPRLPRQPSRPTSPSGHLHSVAPSILMGLEFAHSTPPHRIQPNSAHLAWCSRTPARRC